MTTSELISYIRNQIKNNIPEDIIISKLAKAGWHREDIDEGFLSVHLDLKLDAKLNTENKEINNNIDTNKRKTLDQYREPVTDDVIDFDSKIESPNTEEPKKETTKMEVFDIKTISTPTVEISNVEIPKTEIKTADILAVESIKTESVLNEPKSVEIKTVEIPEIEKPQVETYDIEIPNGDISSLDVITKENSSKDLETKEPSAVEKFDIDIPITETPKTEEPVIKEESNSEEVKVEEVKSNELEIFNTEIPAVLVVSVAESKDTKIEEPAIKEESKIEPHELEVFNVEIPAAIAVSNEISKINIPEEAPIIENKKTETSGAENYKIWTPMKVPIKEESEIKTSDLGMTPKESTEIIMQNRELTTNEEGKLDGSLKTENINETPEKVISPDVVVNEEFIPILIPKPVVEVPVSVEKINDFKAEAPAVFSETSKNFLFENLPKTAMLSSYENDFSSANKVGQEVSKNKSYKIFKLILIALLSVLVVGGVTWAFMSGYISLENLPFVKKDPKILLLNNSKVLSSLKSYKTETSIEISSPSFANITLGIISGEVIPSLDEDSISINTLGKINQNEEGLLSDNSLTIKSSLLEDDIIADIKNNKSDIFLTASDFSQLIKESNSDPVTVKINEEQFDLIPGLFPPEVEVELKKLNIYKLLSNGMLSYINNDTLNVYDEFINNVKVTEKGQENIKGVDTYRYSINTDRQLIKKLLTKVADDFTLDVSAEDKSKYTDIIGSVTVDSFEVWVGKGDNNIYQYNIILNAPLSKILSFEDKSIGDNKVKFSWKTTFFDFDVSNDISMPEESTDITDFVKTIKEAKIKNEVSTFKQLATTLFNAEGSYGKISNPKGSCMSPISGSLFSPIGHTKGSSTAVSSISELLNSVLKTTNNQGLCYSTAKAWSFTIPITDNYDIASIPAEGHKSYFCIDNTGASKNLIIPPIGVVCE